MKKDGYLIARTRKVDEFFTSSSAYDRPKWAPAATATTYRTVELAESALKKLLRAGAYEARLVTLEEAMSFEMPGEEPATLPSDEERAKLDAEGGSPDDLPTEAPEDDAEQMVAGGDPLSGENAPMDADQESEAAAADIQAKVDAKLGLSADGQTDELDAELDPDAEIDPEDPMSALAGDEARRAEEDPDALPDLLGKPGMTESTTAMKDIPVMSFRNDKTDVEPQVTPPCKEEKITVPASTMAELRAVIADFKKQADFSDTRDDTRATFAMTVVAACEELADLLSQGTADSMKWAQIKMTSWMSPITSNIPTSVVKFVQMGGRKPSLKDLFDSKRVEKKAK